MNFETREYVVSRTLLPTIPCAPTLPKPLIEVTSDRDHILPLSGEDRWAKNLKEFGLFSLSHSCCARRTFTSDQQEKPGKEGEASTARCTKEIWLRPQEEERQDQPTKRATWPTGRGAKKWRENVAGQIEPGTSRERWGQWQVSPMKMSLRYRKTCSTLKETRKKKVKSRYTTEDSVLVTEGRQENKRAFNVEEWR